MNGGIDVAALEKTITDSKWESAPNLDFIKTIREYALDSNEFKKETTILNL
jgi:hypothetical protein